VPGMRAFVVIAAVLLASAAINALNAPDTMKMFQEFETRFNKQYSSHAERMARYNIFTQNLKLVDELNRKNGKPAFGVTKFMDIHPDEFAATYLTSRIDPNDLPVAPMPKVTPDELPKIDALPVSYNWYTHSPAVVTPIKNQEQCGSCWAFSATEQIESVWALAGHPIVALAPQQIVDCDKTCEGCGGGFTQRAYEYVISAGGLEPETDYPYTGSNGQCTFKSADVAAKISSWRYVSNHAGDENSTMLPFLYSTAPISVCVDAASWQFYSGGVLKTCGTAIDHCVQITGYLTYENDPAWIVRNSWGTDWGLQGFIYVQRNTNTCAIATVATTATAASSV
jgi:cathepsin F